MTRYRHLIGAVGFFICTSSFSPATATDSCMLGFDGWQAARSPTGELRVDYLVVCDEGVIFYVRPSKGSLAAVLVKDDGGSERMRAILGRRYVEHQSVAVGKSRYEASIVLSGGETTFHYRRKEATLRGDADIYLEPRSEISPLVLFIILYPG